MKTVIRRIDMVNGPAPGWGHRWGRMICALALALVLTLPSASVAFGQEWPQFQNDALNSGKTSEEGPVFGITQKWKKYTASTGTSGINTTPVIGDGKVFVLSISGRVYAYNAGSGAVEWTRDLGSDASFPFELATPCYAEGKLFVAKQDGEVWALNADTGATVWGPIQLGAVTDQLNTPVTYADGRIYIGSANGAKSYYCLNAATGDPVWSRAGTHGMGYYWAGSCAIGDYLVYGGDDGWLTSVDKGNGTLVDEENLGNIWGGAAQIRSSVSYDAGTGRIYLTEQGGCCWAYDFNAITGNMTYQWHSYIGWSTSTPTSADGRVYVGHGSFGSGGELHCLDDTDGSEIWTFDPPNGGGVESSPVLSMQGSDTYIYITANCADGAAYCVDEDGNQVWEYMTAEEGTSGGYVLQGVALADGSVYFGNDGGYLYALLGADSPPWDVNGDSVIDIFDLVKVALKIGEPGGIPEDVNGDGVVDLFDLVKVAMHLGE